jgi:hypothetical protein
MGLDLLPRYQRRLREVNEAVVATYLAGGNTRRLRGALSPLLKAAPLSKSAVSRIVGTLKAELETWRTRSLAPLDVVGLYLDALALRVRSAGKVVSVPVLGVVAVLTDGQKQLLALELCPGGETFEAWKGPRRSGERGPRRHSVRDRWTSRTPEGRRPRVAPGPGPAVCRPQAAEPRAQGAEARPRGDPGRLPSH